MAGGIAHDFNNILTIIAGNAGLALDDIPADSPARKSIEKILKASGKEAPEAAKRVLELNIDHPAIDKIKVVFEKDKNDPVLKDYCHLLHDMALISEGGKVEDPSRFSKVVGDLMARAIDG